MRNLAVLVLNYEIINFSQPNILVTTKSVENILCLRGFIGVIA